MSPECHGYASVQTDLFDEQRDWRSLTNDNLGFVPAFSTFSPDVHGWLPPAHGMPWWENRPRECVLEGSHEVMRQSLDPVALPGLGALPRVTVTLDLSLCLRHTRG